MPANFDEILEVSNCIIIISLGRLLVQGARCKVSGFKKNYLFAILPNIPIFKKLRTRLSKIQNKQKLCLTNVLE